MGLPLRRDLFPVDTRTWVTVLHVGIGFALVSTLSLFAGGAPWRAGVGLAIAGVFAYTARVLSATERGRHRTAAVVGNVFLTLLAIVVIGVDAAEVLQGGLGRIHPIVLTISAMSSLVQVAVIVVAVESWGRLERGVDREHAYRG